MKNRFDWFVNRDGFLDGALLATGLIIALLVFLRLVDVYL